MRRLVMPAVARWSSRGSNGGYSGSGVSARRQRGGRRQQRARDLRVNPFWRQFCKPGLPRHSGIGDPPRATRSATVRLCGPAALTGCSRHRQPDIYRGRFHLDNTVVAVASGTMNFQGNVTGAPPNWRSSQILLQTSARSEFSGSNGGYSGNVFLSGGSVAVGSDNALGGGILTLSQKKRQCRQQNSDQLTRCRGCHELQARQQ